MKEEKHNKHWPTEAEIQDALEFIYQLGYAAKDEVSILIAAYYHQKETRQKAATIYQDTIADEFEARIKSETALHALRKRINEINAYLISRCKQTCGRQEDKLKHEPNCPAYDLRLVDS